MAEWQEPLADSGEKWDCDPWLLGAGNGVIDLKSGELREGAPEDRITMHVPSDFDLEAECPRWEKFLREIFCDNEDVIHYIQRAVGYSLTGDTSEQCLFLCWGVGSNGKSTFLNVLYYVLGDYALNLPFSAFELKARASIPNDVATIAGRRFVTAVETNAETRLNEARVKALTGGDSITARFLYGEHFTFTPAAKFWLAFNDKPVINDTTHAMWRRVRLIPFTRTFAKNEKLESELKGEAEGILAWAVVGCLLWQGLGLDEPDVVTVATEDYRAESDAIGDFISECCNQASDARVLTQVMYDAYKGWAGEDAVSLKAFTRRLQQKGFEKKQCKAFENRWTWFGLGLKGNG
jgi:putative DNA primase/helicase